MFHLYAIIFLNGETVYNGVHRHTKWSLVLETISYMKTMNLNGQSSSSLWEISLKLLKIITYKHYVCLVYW